MVGGRLRRQVVRWIRAMAAGRVLVGRPAGSRRIAEAQLEPQREPQPILGVRPHRRRAWGLRGGARRHRQRARDWRAVGSGRGGRRARGCRPGRRRRAAAAGASSRAGAGQGRRRVPSSRASCWGGQQAQVGWDGPGVGLGSGTPTRAALGARAWGRLQWLVGVREGRGEGGAQPRVVGSGEDHPNQG